MIMKRLGFKSYIYDYNVKLMYLSFMNAEILGSSGICAIKML